MLVEKIHLAEGIGSSDTEFGIKIVFSVIVSLFRIVDCPVLLRQKKK